MADRSATSSDSVEKFKTYVTTPKGLILAAEIVLCVTVNICYVASVYHEISYVAISGMIMAIIVFCVYMMELDKQFLRISWVWTDLFRTVVHTAWFIIESLYVLIRWPGDGAWVAGGIFSFIAGFVFAYDAYTIYLKIKSARQNTAVNDGEV